MNKRPQFICGKLVYLRAPNETVPPPQGDVLVLAGGGEHFFVRVHRKSDQQLTVTKHDLKQDAKNDSYLYSNFHKNAALMSDNFDTDFIASKLYENLLLT